MERHVCYTISYSKLACGIEKGGGLEMGVGGTQNVSTWLSLLAPSSPFFFFFSLAKEADGPNFKPKLLVRVPKVSQHDVDDRNLIDFGSINLHHSLSVALPRLQDMNTEIQRSRLDEQITEKCTHSVTYFKLHETFKCVFKLIMTWATGKSFLMCVKRVQLQSKLSTLPCFTTNVISFQE